MNSKKVDFGPIRADFDPFGPLPRERDFSWFSAVFAEYSETCYFILSKKKVQINGLDLRQNSINPILGT